MVGRPCGGGPRPPPTLSDMWRRMVGPQWWFGFIPGVVPSYKYKALVGDLPAQDHQSDRKGKAVDIPNWVGNEDDDWGEDELLADCDSD